MTYYRCKNKFKQSTFYVRSWTCDLNWQKCRNC